MAGGNVSPGLASLFNAAGAQEKIPPAVLAGIASVESNLGANTGPSSTGARGMMQFEPGTAQSIGVNVNDPRSEIFGAAKLLNQYGYQQNPLRAIGAYNGGPGNPQMSYAQQVMAEASRLAPQLKGHALATFPAGMRFGAPTATTVGVRIPTFDQAGFQQAQRAYAAGRYLEQNNALSPSKDPYLAGAPKTGLEGLTNPALLTGRLTTSEPNPADYQGAQTVLEKVAGVPLSLHPVLREGTIAGGFLPKGATYIQGRKDQGRDGQTNPGGAIVANGDGVVVAVKSDPGGFGPSYPEVHFTSGPEAGHTLYFGHTLAAVAPGQHVSAGEVISHTGKSPVGNATVPGWFEIGYADSGAPGPFGQQVPF
jgi:hypothetical protein